MTKMNLRLKPTKADIGGVGSLVMVNGEPCIEAWDENGRRVFVRINPDKARRFTETLTIYINRSK